MNQGCAKNIHPCVPCSVNYSENICRGVAWMKIKHSLKESETAEAFALFNDVEGCTDNNEVDRVVSCSISVVVKASQCPYDLCDLPVLDLWL
jgi:hypothetical protein